MSTSTVVQGLTGRSSILGGDFALSADLSIVRLRISQQKPNRLKRYTTKRRRHCQIKAGSFGNLRPVLGCDLVGNARIAMANVDQAKLIKGAGHNVNYHSRTRNGEAFAG